MRSLPVLLVLVLAASGCGGTTAASNLITSTPNTAALAAAEANVRDGGTALEAYFTENGSYAGATADTLRLLQPALSPTVSVTATAAGYCVQSVVDGAVASLRGPGGGDPQAGSCS
jgi:hypothetical protein